LIQTFDNFIRELRRALPQPWRFTYQTGSSAGSHCRAMAVVQGSTA